MKRIIILLLLMASIGIASAQTYIDFRKPMRMIYGNDEMTIEFDGDTVIIYANHGKFRIQDLLKVKELYADLEIKIRDTTLLDFVNEHGGESYIFDDGLTESSGTVKFGGTFNENITFYDANTSGLQFIYSLTQPQALIRSETASESAWTKNSASSNAVESINHVEQGTEFANTGSVISTGDGVYSSLWAASGETESMWKVIPTKATFKAGGTEIVHIDATGAYTVADESSTYTDRHYVDKAYANSLGHVVYGEGAASSTILSSEVVTVFGEAYNASSNTIYIFYATSGTGDGSIWHCSVGDPSDDYWHVVKLTKL